MKKILFVCSAFISLVVAGQKNDAPADAKNAFAKSYPNASNIKWDKENGAFEVDFQWNGKKMSALYDAKGVLKESEVSIPVSELPATVSEYLAKNYKGIPVKGAAKITKADGTVNLEAEIKGKDILFDTNGKFIKEVKD